MPATKSKSGPTTPVEVEAVPGPRNVILHADAIGALADLPVGHADLTVFSPPYDGIPDYGKNWNLDYKTLGYKLFFATRVGGVCAVVFGDGEKGFDMSMRRQHASRRN